MAAPIDPPAGLLDHPGATRVPSEEVRFAVVLNGGVSLAVWMGGVVLELDRLTKAARTGSGAYAVLKQLTGCHARADVITGTSAGGINGAALALTQVNRRCDPALLRDLWIDQGRLETLLRPPFQGQPTSLLRGDEYFLPKLNAALRLLAQPRGHWDSEEAPIDLTITTTVIRGNQSVSVDSMGQRLPQRLHAGRFRWQRRVGATGEADPFSPENLPRTADRLALAARSSASFPLAFEPSYVPVDDPDHREPDADRPLTEELRLRPDMAAVVRAWGSGAGRDRSRYCADGGVLSNTPTREALEPIEAMPASGPVRRVVLLVFPHAPTESDDPPDEKEEPPTLAGSLTGILGALTAQGSRTYVEELERHNLAAAGRRGTRHDLVDQLGGPDELAALTRAIQPQYRRLRRWRAGRDLAAWRTGTGPDQHLAAETLPAGWSFDRVRAAAEHAQSRWDRTRPAGREPLPYVPREAPTAETVVHRGWAWGLSAALGVTEASADLLRRLVWLLETCPDYDRVELARRTVFDLSGRLRATRALTDAVWRDEPVLASLVPDVGYWTLRLACYDHLMVGSVTRDEISALVAEVAADDAHAARIEASLAATLAPAATTPAYVGERVRDLVERTVETLRPCLTVLAEQADSLAGRDRGLPGWRRVLVPEPRPDLVPAEVILARLLQLEIASTTLGDEVTTGASFPVELVQVSAQTRDPFARHTLTGDDKLGGAAVSRFGGFLKRSWRVNDWIWGRADGATSLARTMLDPSRIRRTALLSGYLDPQHVGSATPEDLARATVHGVLDRIGSCPEADLLREQAVRQLAPVFDLSVGDAELPSALPALADIFAWALHLESLPPELPVLAQAVAADRVDGASPRSRGELFVAEHADLLRRLDVGRAEPGGLSDADRREALEVFDRAGVGREPLREESGSELVIRTATSAAAVMTTVADSGGSGLTALKPVTRTLRGAMLLPYWALWSLTSRQTLGRVLALLAFALGGGALVLALLGVLSSGLQPVAAALGGGALLAAFAYGALRTGSLLHGIVLLTPVVPLVAYAIAQDRDNRDGLSTLVAVVAVVLALMLLGSIGVASGSVWAALDRLADRQGFVRPRRGRGRLATPVWGAKVWLRRAGSVLWAVVSALAVLAVCATAALAVWWLVAPGRIGFVQDNHRFLWVAALLAVAASAVLAHRGGRWLQVLTNRSADEAAPRWEYAPVSDPAAVSAGWAVLYGTAYLLVAWLISLEALGEENPLWRRVAFATPLVFAVVLLLLPAVLPVRAVAAAARREVARASGIGADEVAAPDRADRLVRGLVARGVAHRRFVTHDEHVASLTEHGQRLDRRICDARAATALATAWEAPHEPDASDVQRLRAVLPVWSEGFGACVSTRPAKALEQLRRVLDDDDADPMAVRHAVDRVLAGLRRSRGR